MEEVVKQMEDNIGLIIFIIFSFSIILAIVEFFYELYKKKINKWRLGEMWASFLRFYHCSAYGKNIYFNIS